MRVDGFGSRRPGDISRDFTPFTMDFEPRMEALGWESPDEDLIQVDENVPAALRSAAYASYGRRFDDVPQESLQLQSLRRELLGSETLPRVIDLFRKIDKDKSHHISRSEFQKCLPMLNLSKSGVVDAEDMGELFDAIDADGSGQIEYSELHAMLRKRAPHAVSGVMKTGAVKIEVRSKDASLQKYKIRSATDGAPPWSRKLQKEATVEEIREHLVSGMSRVIDFFRACDENGDGKISRQEFHAAMPKLGIGASSVDTIDELYESFDLDGDGTLEYRELHTILRYEARRKVTSSPVRRRR